MLNVGSGIQVSMRLIPTDLTAKRLLVGSIGAVHIMTHAALLGGIGALDPDGGDASLGGVSGDLPGDVREIRSTHVGIHGSGLVLHGGDREVFIGELRALVPGKALVDRPVDLLTDVAGETFPASARG